MNQNLGSSEFKEVWKRIVGKLATECVNVKKKIGFFKKKLEIFQKFLEIFPEKSQFFLRIFSEKSKIFWSLRIFPGILQRICADISEILQKICADIQEISYFSRICVDPGRALPQRRFRRDQVETDLRTYPGDRGPKEHLSPIGRRRSSKMKIWGFLAISLSRKPNFP